MKFDMSCKVFSIAFTKLLKAYYNDNFSDIDIDKYAKDVKKEYKAMILRTPELSKDNMMKGNLKGAAYFFAMAKVLPNMTPELMDKLVKDSMYSPFMVKLHKSKKEKGTLFSKKYKDKMYKDSLRSQNSEYEMDWKYTFDYGTDKEYGYNISKCGVCRLAERENLLDYLPCMCHMDFPKYDIQGATLERTKTLADGDEVCNFHLIKQTKTEEK